LVVVCTVWKEGSPNGEPFFFARIDGEHRTRPDSEGEISAIYKTVKIAECGSEGTAS